MILARLLTQAEYGSFRQILMVTFLFYIFTYFCLSESASYYLASLNKTDKKKFVFQTLVFFLILGAISSLALIFSRGFIATSFSNPDLGKLLLIASVFPALMMFSTFSSVSLITVGRAKLISIIAFFATVLQILALVIPIVLGSNLESALVWYTIVRVVTTAIQVFLLIKIIGIIPVLDKTLIKEQLKFSIPYWISYATFILYTQIHKILVSVFFTADQFALFSVASTEIPILTKLASQIALVLIPVCVQFLEQKKVNKIIDIWQKSATKVAMVILPVYIFLSLSAKDFLIVMFGNKYGKAWPIFLIILLLLPLKICDTQSLFKITGRTQYVIYVSIIALIIGLGSGWALIYPLGILGPVIGTILGRLAQITTALIFINKDLPLSFFQAFAVKYNYKVLLAALTAFVPVKLLTLAIHLPLVTLALNGMVGGVLFIIILYKFGLMHQEDLELIKRWVTLRPIFEK